MIVERFEMEKHYNQILKWNTDRGRPPVDPDMLPTIGFIVDNIAAVFLYRTDSSIVFIEGLITNKLIDKSVAKIAQGLVIDSAMRAAKELGFKVLLALTNITSVISRAESHGSFNCGPHILLKRDL